jgi:hypothetical protein
LRSLRRFAPFFPLEKDDAGAGFLRFLGEKGGKSLTLSRSRCHLTGVSTRPLAMYHRQITTSIRTKMPHPIALILTLLIGAGIGWFTLTPPGEGSTPLPLTDKQLHALAFGLLVLPVALTRPRALWWLAPLALAYGAMIELIQPSVGRSGEWADLWADALGIALVCGLGVLRGRSHAGART